jgi:biotin carboxylase
VRTGRRPASRPGAQRTPHQPDRPLRILVVGAGYEQAPIIQRARQRGLHVIALDGNPDAPGLRHAHTAHVVSTRDDEGILDVARSERIDAITSMVTETPLRAIYHVATALGLPAPSERSVVISTDKAAMRDAFTSHGIPNPSYVRCNTQDDAAAAADRIGLPLIVKPTDSGGQRGLTICHEPAEVPAAFDHAQSASHDLQAIIERFVPGPEVNVVAVILGGRLQAMTTSDRIKHDTDAFGVVRRHVYPSRAAAPWSDALRSLVQRSAEAMDVRDGIVFPQLVITDDGPVFLETGARIPGGTMNELFHAATGIDLIDLQIDLSLGHPGPIESYQRHRGHPSVVVRFLTADPGELNSGPVASITGENDAARTPFVLALGHFAGTRDRGYVHPLRTGGDRYYYLLTAAPDQETALAACDVAWQHLDFLDESGRSRRANPDQPS